MENTERPAFTVEEVDYLSMTLSRAFAKAQPQEWVVFSLSEPGPAHVTEMTTGAWYVEGTTLHLLLANYRAAVRMNNIRDVLDRDPLFDVYGSPRYEFVATEYAQEGSEKKSLLSMLRQDTPHLAIEYQQLLAGSLGHKDAREEEGEGSSSLETGGMGVPPSSIDERLETLKRLKERQLITEEDYQRRKKELLDQL